MLLLNDLPVKHFKTSSGELQVNLDQFEPERAILTWKPKNSDDIMLLLLTVNALKHLGCGDIILDVLYLPYGCQDRVCAPRAAFSLEVITKILDGLDVSNIRLWDSHNANTINMFPNTCIHETEIKDIFSRYNILNDFDLSNLILCAPDHGSSLKVDDIVNEFDLSCGIHFSPLRNPTSGLIESIHESADNRNFDGYNILVIYDFCDSARAFIQLAQELRKVTVENLYLYVTHGIFRQGFEELYEHYQHIYCHHVLDDKIRSNERLTILREFPHPSQSAVCF